MMRQAVPPQLPAAGVLRARWCVEDGAKSIAAQSLGSLTVLGWAAHDGPWLHTIIDGDDARWHSYPTASVNWVEWNPDETDVPR